VNLRQARCLDAVARHGSFRTAAAELLVTQPAVSQGLGSLERELGVQLVTRSPRGAVLTSEGRALLPRIRALINAEDSALREAGVLRRGLGGTVKVSSVNLALVEVFAPAIATFVERCPDHEIEVREASAELVQQRIQEGEDDLGAFGVVGPSIPTLPGAVARALGTIELWVAVPAGHPASDVECFGPEDLAAHPLVLFHEGWAIRDVVEWYLAGRSPWVICQVSEVGATKALVAAGVGLSVLPRPPATAPDEGIVYRRLDPPMPVLTRVLAEPDRPSRPTAVAAFVEILEASLDRSLP
jgi:DNA-binding transcriptional LysR family regulator